ncbi:MAG: FAD-dependent oxidoreductase [Myxococcales bacterium]|nr:FAD-dependent oxidoreductase [Myxococcales bacterium]
MDFDVLVVGGGMAGLGAAKAAADLGAKVALAEPEQLGGT